jgi:hypothetical protein
MPAGVEGDGPVPIVAVWMVARRDGVGHTGPRGRRVRLTLPTARAT